MASNDAACGNVAFADIWYSLAPYAIPNETRNKHYVLFCRLKARWPLVSFLRLNICLSESESNVMLFISGT